MAAVFGATPTQVFKYIVLYEALPQIFIGLRLAVSFSLIVAIVSEMFIGTELGLGQRVYDSYLTNNTTSLYAILLVLGLLGYVLNKFISLIETKFIFWGGK